MAAAVPTVLATTPSEYEGMLKRASSLSSRVHVDISDGEFAENKTVALTQVSPVEGVKIDLHLMVTPIHDYLETALSLHPHLIIIHAESKGDLADVVQTIKSLGVKAGVALLPQTEVSSASALIASADHVLIFTGTLGQNGGVFQADQLQRVAEVKAINPTVEVSIDGGVSLDTAPAAVAAGVDVLYTGGYIQNAPDPRAAFTELQKTISA